MEIKVLFFVRNELFYLARSSSLEALSYPSCCCLCRGVPVKKSSIFKAGKLLLVHVALFKLNSRVTDGANLTPSLLRTLEVNSA